MRTEAGEKIKDVLSEAVKAVLQNPDWLVYGGLAYIGYTSKLRLLDAVSGVPVSLLFGPVALKLATTDAGDTGVKLGLGGIEMPVNSQVMGMAMLAALGIAKLPWDQLAEKYKSVTDRLDAYGVRLDILAGYIPWWNLIQGARLLQLRCNLVAIRTSFLIPATEQSILDLGNQITAFEQEIIGTPQQTQAEYESSTEAKMFQAQALRLTRVKNF